MAMARSAIVQRRSAIVLVVICSYETRGVEVLLHPPVQSRTLHTRHGREKLVAAEEVQSR